MSASTNSQGSNEKNPLIGNHLMWKVVVSPKEEHVLVLTNKQQIYNASGMSKDQAAESKVHLLKSLGLF